MARKNNFVKEKYPNIYSLETVNNRTHYYASFMLGGVSHQKINLTKMYNATTAKQASDALEYLKSELRANKNPFNEVGDKVEDIVLEKIKDRKPKNDMSAYKKKLEGFYYKYIHDIIGRRKIDKVKDEDVKKIMKQLDGYKKEYKQNVQILMFRIFEQELRKGNIRYNPFYDIDYGTHSNKPDFDIRLNEPIEEVARKIYKIALEYSARYKLFFIMTIMLARRVGEIHKLRCGNIKKSSNGDWYILAKRDITKTEIDERYPLPSEVVDLLPQEVLDEEYENEKLFDFSEASISYNWNKLVKQAKIDINKGYTLTSHDSRKLFLSILASRGVDTDLADRCISHKRRGIKGVYLDVPYDIRKKIFETWWDFLRDY
ncbi:MAG: tyrosine-type recombinase/integrase [Arcobacter sp.]|nr:tyrosine-type recombinase/integrase [Arcobacter sp.]